MSLSLVRYAANDVGVSQTRTARTSSPWSRDMSKISLAMRSTVGLLSSLKIGSPSFSSGSTSGIVVAQDHLVIQLAIDPALDDALDVGEIGDHVALVEPVRAHVHLDDGVVSVRMLADAVVVEQAMAVAEVDALGDEVHDAL